MRIRIQGTKSTSEFRVLAQGSIIMVLRGAKHIGVSQSSKIERMPLSTQDGATINITNDTSGAVTIHIIVKCVMSSLMEGNIPCA